MAGNRTKGRQMSGNRAVSRGAPKAAVPRAQTKMDRRVERTRDVLGDALVALLHEKPLDSITVQHVLDRAGVARSTFYSHYSDKNDLLLSDAEDFFQMMSTLLTRRGEKSNRVAPVREFFAHAAGWREFLTALAKSEKIRDIFEMGQGYFARAIESRLAVLPAARSLNAKRRSALAHAYAGAMNALLQWWLNHGTRETAEEMDDLFHRIVWCGVTMPVR
jgi:AcrR family transcriptional regulator